MIFETTAPKRRFKMGLQDITLRHRSPRLMNVNDARVSDLLRALRHLGPGGLTPVMVARFAAVLQPADKRTLRKYRRRAPLWLHPVIDAIASEQP